MCSSIAAQSSSVFMICGNDAVSLVGPSVMIFAFSENAEILGTEHLRVYRVFNMTVCNDIRLQ
jgi:hypothetical protein